MRKISPPPGFDPRTAQPVASHYTDCATWPTNLSLLAPYFWLFQLCLSAAYRVAPWAAAWLACHLVQSWALQWFEMRTSDVIVLQWCLRFSEQCWYRLQPSQIWRCVDWYISTDVTEVLARYKSTHCNIPEDWSPHLAQLALYWLPWY
jgi:hypothetical protein